MYFILQNAKYLKELYLSRNQFGSEAGEILGPAIGTKYFKLFKSYLLVCLKNTEPVLHYSCFSLYIC